VDPCVIRGAARVEGVPAGLGCSEPPPVLGSAVSDGVGTSGRVAGGCLSTSDRADDTTSWWCWTWSWCVGAWAGGGETERAPAGGKPVDYNEVVSTSKARRENSACTARSAIVTRGNWAATRIPGAASVDVDPRVVI